MRRILAASIIALASASTALAWSAHGHRPSRYLALEGLPADAPAWLRDASTRNRIADESNEPDRWRGLQSLTLAHENSLDHYIDVEDLAKFGLTLQTVSPFRYEYMRDLAVALHTHPEAAGDYDPCEGPRPHQAVARLPAARHPGALQQAALLLQHAPDSRIAQRPGARRSGQDGARGTASCRWASSPISSATPPSPCTPPCNHHGWVGENPNGYTREGGIHSYIDGAIVDLHALTVESLRPSIKVHHHAGPEGPVERRPDLHPAQLRPGRAAVPPREERRPPQGAGQGDDHRAAHRRRGRCSRPSTRPPGPAASPRSRRCWRGPASTTGSPRCCPTRMGRRSPKRRRRPRSDEFTTETRRHGECGGVSLLRHSCASV